MNYYTIITDTGSVYKNLPRVNAISLATALRSMGHHGIIRRDNSRPRRNAQPQAWRAEARHEETEMAQQQQHTQQPYTAPTTRPMKKEERGLLYYRLLTKERPSGQALLDSYNQLMAGVALEQAGRAARARIFQQRNARRR